MMQAGTLKIVLIGLLVVGCSSRQEAPSSGSTVTAPSPVQFAGDSPETRKPDVIFVPTPEPVVSRMLTLAAVGPDDVVYDLGCGDGRIVIAAARDFGARGVCIDIDPKRVAEARANVKRAGVEDKVEVRHGDLFQIDTSPATVVSLYLLESLNLKLRPKLQRELRPGARIVSQSFSMGDWRPDAQVNVNGTPVYMWKIGGRSAQR